VLERSVVPCVAVGVAVSSAISCFPSVRRLAPRTILHISRNLVVMQPGWLRNHRGVVTASA
jgi:hypothetical protein